MGRPEPPFEIVGEQLRFADRPKWHGEGYAGTTTSLGGLSCLGCLGGIGGGAWLVWAGSIWIGILLILALPVAGVILDPERKKVGRPPSDRHTIMYCDGATRELVRRTAFGTEIDERRESYDDIGVVEIERERDRRRGHEYEIHFGNQLRFEVYESYDEAEARRWAEALAEFTGLPVQRHAEKW